VKITAITYLSGLPDQRLHEILIDAGRSKDHATINAVTDVIALRQKARPRNDDSMLHQLRQQCAERSGARS